MRRKSSLNSETDLKLAIATGSTKGHLHVTTRRLLRHSIFCYLCLPHPFAQDNGNRQAYYAKQ